MCGFRHSYKTRCDNLCAPCICEYLRPISCTEPNDDLAEAERERASCFFPNSLSLLIRLNLAAEIAVTSCSSWLVFGLLQQLNSPNYQLLRIRVVRLHYGWLILMSRPSRFALCKRVQVWRSNICFNTEFVLSQTRYFWFPLFGVWCAAIFEEKCHTPPFGFECPFAPSLFHTLCKCRFQRAELNVSRWVQPQHFSKCHLAIGKNEQWMSSWRSTAAAAFITLFSSAHLGNCSKVRSLFIKTHIYKEFMNIFKVFILYYASRRDYNLSLF